MIGGKVARMPLTIGSVLIECGRRRRYHHPGVLLFSSLSRDPSDVSLQLVYHDTYSGWSDFISERVRVTAAAFYTHFHGDEKEYHTERPVTWVAWVLGDLLFKQMYDLRLVIKIGFILGPVALARQAKLVLCSHEDETSLISWIDGTFDGWHSKDIIFSFRLIMAGTVVWLKTYSREVPEQLLIRLRRSFR